MELNLEDDRHQEGNDHPEAAEFLPVGYRRVRRQEELGSHAPASPGICSLHKRRTATRLWCGVFFLLAISSGCTSTPPATAPTKDVLVIGTPEGTAAGAENGVRQVARTLSLEGLTQLSADGRAVARLADKWEWENGGLRLRLFLHAGVTFHDGRPMDARLAAEALRAAISRQANRALYPSLNYVTSVEASGDSQVLLNLSQPSAFLPEDLEIPLEIGTNGVGTGAFKVVKTADSEIDLERFDGYHEGTPKIQRIVIRPFETLRTAWTNLLRTDVDMITDVPPEAVEFISNDEVEVIPFERRYQFVIVFNSSKPPFSSSMVRRALNAAVNRDTLVKDVLQGHGTPSTGPFWPKYWAYDTSMASYTFDPPLATSLLDSAGQRMKAATNSSPRARFHFVCLVPAGFSVWERIALEVQRNLYNVGVDMQFKVVPFQEFDTLIREGNFEAAFTDLISGPTPGRAYIFWRSGRRFKGLNVFGYENPEAERLFDVLRTSSNEAAVRSATRGLQRVFLDDPPALFLAWTQRARAVRRNFQIPTEPGRDPILTLWRGVPIASPSVLAASVK
jgi:peptide/nickel transport system substrate-binding protein